MASLADEREHGQTGNLSFTRIPAWLLLAAYGKNMTTAQQGLPTPDQLRGR